MLSKWDPSTWSFQKFSSLLCYPFCPHCYPNTIPCYQMFQNVPEKLKFLPCMKSVVWGWINVLKKYWRNVPFFCSFKSVRRHEMSVMSVHVHVRVHFKLYTYQEVQLPCNKGTIGSKPEVDYYMKNNKKHLFHRH